MGKTIRKIISLLAVLTVMIVPMTATAAASNFMPDLPEENYSLTVLFTKDNGSIKLDGATVGIRQAASLSVAGGNAVYTLLDKYQKYGGEGNIFDGMTAAESEELAAVLAKAGGTSEKMAVTDASGSAVFTGLEPGMYLVTEDSKTGTAAEYEDFEAFLVSVPEAVQGEEGNLWQTSVTAEPKTTVKKISSDKEEETKKDTNKSTDNSTDSSRRTVSGGGGSSSSVRTYDSANMQLWAIIMAASALALIPVAVYKKKEGGKERA